MASNPSEHKTPYYKVDVVPYITKLETRLNQANVVFNRSAMGTYPVMRGEAGVKLYGFNLKGANTTVKFNGTSVGSVTAKPSTETSIEDYVSFTVSTGATSGEIEVSVIGKDTTNQNVTIISLNNVNSPSADYNLEPNGQNNDNLDDNRNVYVWGINDIFNETVKTIRYPTFRIGKDEDQTYAFVYDHDGRTVRYTINGAGPVVLDTSYSQWYGTGCAVDTSGHLYASAQNGDTGGGGTLTTPKDPDTEFNVANYKFYALADTKNGVNYSTTQGAYSDGGNNVALESAVNGRLFAERVRNPKIVTLGSDKTKMYTVYYDISYPRLVFRYGEAKSGVSFTSGFGIVSRGSNSSAANAQVIESSSNVGEYAAVGVVPAAKTGTLNKDVAVVCWNSENQLLFKYNTDPTKDEWSNTLTVDEDFAGEYCDLAVDDAGGIHIAYYRAGNKLKYAYLPTYAAAKADVEVCMVDSYLSVGENISIATSSKTITKNGVTRYVPYISYYSSAIGMAKVAWPDKLYTNSETNKTYFGDGANSDKFTGLWEVQVVPTALTTKLLNYTIGVGEKKAGTKQSVMLGYGTRTGLQTALLY